ncbi:MAG: HAD family hydrolase [Candidatus Aenigmatarchaeota archaeon]|nr:Cof-type HAD-IIB family hydrolase [Nanoarchaeota archaeon]
MLVICDNDGVFGNFSKEVAPWDEDLGPHLEDLKRIREHVTNTGDTYSICTGRSLPSTRDIMRLTGINGPCMLEMGNLILSPGGDMYRLVDTPEYSHLRQSSDRLAEWGRYAAENEDNIFASLIDSGLRLRYLKDREHIFTWEITGSNFTGYQLYDALNNGYLECIRGDLESGRIAVLLSAKAIDFMPAINKGDAVRHVMNEYGFKAENVAAVGDSGHSDIPMMEPAGYVACPSNADDATLDYVRGRGGYVSDHSFADGTLDILRYIDERR